MRRQRPPYPARSWAEVARRSVGGQHLRTARQATLRFSPGEWYMLTQEDEPGATMDLYAWEFKGQASLNYLARYVVAGPFPSKEAAKAWETWVMTPAADTLAYSSAQVRNVREETPATQWWALHTRRLMTAMTPAEINEAARQIEDFWEPMMWRRR